MNRRLVEQAPDWHARCDRMTDSTFLPSPPPLPTTTKVCPKLLPYDCTYRVQQVIMMCCDDKRMTRRSLGLLYKVHSRIYVE